MSHSSSSAGEHEGEGTTRSEERLRVGTTSEETGRVRLCKYVVTEEEHVITPVRHEEVRLEREPLDGTDRRGEGVGIGEDAQEVTLHAERPVVDKQTEAVEKVRLGKDTRTEDQTVSETVRKEHIDVDDPHHHLDNTHRDHH